MLLLSGCQEELRYGEQINAQNRVDASRVQNEVVSDIVRNANPILSLIMNHPTNIFSASQLDGLLTQEMDRTQKAIVQLEKYRQPESLEDETTQTLRSLIQYKSSLLYLREKVRNQEEASREVQQFIESLNMLQSSHYVKP